VKEKYGSGYVDGGSSESKSITVSRYRKGNTDVSVGVLKFIVCDVVVEVGINESAFRSNEALSWTESDRMKWCVIERPFNCHFLDKVGR
jgi:hypothetical protein